MGIKNTKRVLAFGALLASAGFLSACSSGTAGLQNSRPTGDFVSNHPMGCLALAPFCPLIQAYTLLPESAPPQPADPVYATAKPMEACADQFSGKAHASDLAACENKVFEEWAQKGGMNPSAVGVTVTMNAQNGAKVQAGTMPALQAKLERDVLMEKAALVSPPTYAPNPQIVPSSLLGWQQHVCAGRYGTISKQLYVYQALCSNAALEAWARRKNVSYAQIQPLLDGSLAIAFDEQSQRISRAEARTRLEALTKQSGLDFSVPAPVKPGSAAQLQTQAPQDRHETSTGAVTIPPAP